MIKILSALLDSLKALSPTVTLIGGAMSFALSVFNFFNALWAELILKIAAVALPQTMAVTVMSGFEFINYIFPLSELFTFCSAFMTLYLACGVVRIVKSFIPTIS